MITIYIKEYENEDIFENKFQKIIGRILIRFNKILLKEIDENKKIYFIPNINAKNVCERLIKKLNKEESRTQKVQIVLSSKLIKFKSYLKKFKILSGKVIMKSCIVKIVEYVLNKKIEEKEIYVLTNKYCESSVSTIKHLANDVKSINIITKDIERYSVLEDILSEKGIIISVSNNKKKSLKKASIIINIDFNEEELKKYVVNRNAIIINLSEEKIHKIKLFEGIIIEDIKLNLDKDFGKLLKDNYICDKFKNIAVYESFKDIIDINKMNINSIYGNNGKIDEKELINMQKNIDKYQKVN